MKLKSVLPLNEVNELKIVYIFFPKMFHDYIIDYLIQILDWIKIILTNLSRLLAIKLALNVEKNHSDYSCKQNTKSIFDITETRLHHKQFEIIRVTLNMHNILYNNACIFCQFDWKYFKLL